MLKLKSMIAIVDYGMGNLRSVQKAFQKVGADVVITSSSREIENAKGIVLPGVGAFKDCIDNLKRFGIIDSIIKSIEAGKPFLGICLGLQSLFEESEEFGSSEGLGIFKGKVVRFKEMGLKVPHMGWNQVRFVRRPEFLSHIPDNSFFYFVHSYHVVPTSNEIVSGITDYGYEFVSMIYKDNVIATQFHPEKSQTVGLEFIKGFYRFVEQS
ncbi:MAG: imidazole glycerol phosphate synthase subunit HisH [Thermodesulfovibrionales bacterium]|nr:imidazole glycerol phosphate synthase subunit HisH [Thermodesulfovibrionales bacterium]